MSDLVQRLRYASIDDDLLDAAKEAADRIEADEALMRQALEQMESNKYALAVASPTDDIKAYEAIIAALRERLGEKE